MLTHFVFNAIIKVKREAARSAALLCSVLFGGDQVNDRSQEYQLRLNNDYYVVAGNDLIFGHQKMTPREAQLLSIAIAQVLKEDKDFKTYTTTVPELAEFMGIDQSALYRTLKDVCKDLVTRYVEVQAGGENADKNKWKILTWVQSAEYDNGKLTLRLSDDLKPYLLGLNGYYSQTLLGILLSFRSYYAFRTYQYLKAASGANWGFKKEWDFTCEQLRELYQLDEKDKKSGEYKKYPRNYDLIKYTIKSALEELGSSDYVYVYDYEEYKDMNSRRKGKKTLAGVRFKTVFFVTREKKEAYLKNLDKIIAASADDPNTTPA